MPTLMATSTALSCSSPPCWLTMWHWPLLSPWMLVLPMSSDNNNPVLSLQRRISSLLPSLLSKFLLELVVKTAGLREMSPAFKVLWYRSFWCEAANGCWIKEELTFPLGHAYQVSPGYANPFSLLPLWIQAILGLMFLFFCPHYRGKLKHRVKGIQK